MQHITIYDLLYGTYFLFRSMGTYITVYKNSLSIFMQYRLNMALIGISHLVSLSGLVFLWLAIYSSGEQMGGYGLEQIIMYYVFVTLLASTVNEGIGMGFEIVDEINRGEIVHYLLKPFSYLRYKFVAFLGIVSINLMFVGPIVGIAAYSARHVLIFPSIEGWIWFMCSLLLVILLEFFIYTIASLSSFWLEKGHYFIYATILVTGLLDGSLIPLDLFPSWAYQITMYLPFQFLVFVPIKIYSGDIAHPVQTLVLGVLWTFILMLCMNFMWWRGVKKTEGVGR